MLIATEMYFLLASSASHYQRNGVSISEIDPGGAGLKKIRIHTFLLQKNKLDRHKY